MKQLGGSPNYMKLQLFLFKVRPEAVKIIDLNLKSMRFTLNVDAHTQILNNIC